MKAQTKTAVALFGGAAAVVLTVGIGGVGVSPVGGCDDDAPVDQRHAGTARHSHSRGQHRHSHCYPHRLHRRSRLLGQSARASLPNAPRDQPLLRRWPITTARWAIGIFVDSSSPPSTPFADRMPGYGETDCMKWCEWRMGILMRSGARTAVAVFGGAAMLVLAVGCGGGGNKGPSSTTTPTTTTTPSSSVAARAIHRAGRRRRRRTGWPDRRRRPGRRRRQRPRRSHRRRRTRRRERQHPRRWRWRRRPGWRRRLRRQRLRRLLIAEIR